MYINLKCVKFVLIRNFKHILLLDMSDKNTCILLSLRIDKLTIPFSKYTQLRELKKTNNGKNIQFLNRYILFIAMHNLWRVLWNSR